MIYFDNAATTEVAAEVVDDIDYCLRNVWGNPSSPYRHGRVARSLLESSREKVARTIGADPGEIIFTSGGTEANNLAIKAMKSRPMWLLTTPIEHMSVLKAMGVRGVDFEMAPVGEGGLVDLGQLEAVARMCLAPFLMSVGWVNNELGTMQDIAVIARIVHKRGGILHVDGVQAYSHVLPVDVHGLGVDMMSVSGHKWGCPKGVGFLFLSKDVGDKFGGIAPLMDGGHQEMGLRAGTENLPYIYAMANRAEKLSREGPRTGMVEMQEYLVGKLEEISVHGGPEFWMNTPGERGRYMPGILSCTMRHTRASALIGFLDEAHDICIAAGAACSSYESKPSHVLKAIGLSDEEAGRTVRISFGRDTAYQEIDALLSGVREAVNMFY